MNKWNKAYQSRLTNKNIGYAYTTIRQETFGIIYHHPFLFYPNGTGYNFDTDAKDIVCVFKIKRRSFLNMVYYKLKRWVRN